MHKTTTICQFGLIICHSPTYSFLHQFSSIFGGNCIKEQLVLVVHEDFKNLDDSYIELHGVKRYWQVSQEGHPDYFFDAIAPTDENSHSQDKSLMPEAVSEHINGNSRTTETIQALHDEVDVDDDNEPAPENIPQSTDPTSSPSNTDWGHFGFCYRKSLSMQNSGAILNFHINPTEDDYYLKLFEGFFPLLNMIIEGINTKINMKINSDFVNIWRVSTMDRALGNGVNRCRN